MDGVVDGNHRIDIALKAAVAKSQLIDEIVQRYPRFSRKEAEVMANAVFKAMTIYIANGSRKQ